MQVIASGIKSEGRRGESVTQAHRTITAPEVVELVASACGLRYCNVELRGSLFQLKRSICMVNHSGE